MFLHGDLFQSYILFLATTFEPRRDTKSNELEVDFQSFAIQSFDLQKMDKVD